PPVEADSDFSAEGRALHYRAEWPPVPLLPGQLGHRFRYRYATPASQDSFTARRSESGLEHYRAADQGQRPDPVRRPNEFREIHHDGRDYWQARSAENINCDC